MLRFNRNSKKIPTMPTHQAQGKSKPPRAGGHGVCVRVQCMCHWYEKGKGDGDGDNINSIHTVGRTPLSDSIYTTLAVWLQQSG